MKYLVYVLVALFILFGISPLSYAHAAEVRDSDGDGLADQQEFDIYHTNPEVVDTDGDGYTDGEEVTHNYDPNSGSDTKLEKHITVVLKTQTLTYSLGQYQIGSFKISSGVRGKETPRGEYTVLQKLDVNLYKGPGYNYPNTKWNLKFKYSKQGNYYIHGAYWHNRFGTPASHGCVNVSYANMEPLYNWADVGTKITIQ